MKQIRLSYSILEPWSKGDYDEALRRYWREEQQPTQAMIEGKLLHQQWEDEVKKTKCLPQIFGGEKLGVFRTELKLEVQLEDWLQLVGVIDLMNDRKIYDYKTGRTQVSAYSSSQQIPIYQLLAVKSGLDVDEGYYLHFDQHSKTIEKSKRYLTEKTMKDAKDWVITFASEIYSSLEEAGEL